MSTNTATSTHPRGRGRLVTSLTAAAAGALLGAFGAITAIELDVAAQPVPRVDAAEWGSPGHVTMSADAIEHWILNRLQAAKQVGASDPLDPATWGSPGHVTMSADTIEQWIKDRAEATPAPRTESADAAERRLTPDQRP